jgi:hypothetical protein
VCLDVPAQDGVDHRLVPAPALAKEIEHIGVDSQGDLFLGARPEDCVPEERFVQRGDVGKIDLFMPFPFVSNRSSKRDDPDLIGPAFDGAMACKKRKRYRKAGSNSSS